MTTKTLNALWLLLLLGASSLLAQAPAEQAQERLRCIVVLRQGDLSDAEAQRLGGKVEFRSAGRLVLTIPRAAIDALRRNPNVKYIQESRFPGEIAAAAPLSAELTDSPETAAPLAASIPTWSSGDYQYDGAGNIYAIGTNTAPGSDGRSSTYSYDALGRLSAATVVVPGGTFAETYGYDAYGNLKSVTPGGGQPFDLSVNELTNKVAADYDQAGNMVRWGTPRFTYDGANMVSSRTDEGGNVEYYVYSADDERIGVLRGQRWSWTVRGMDQKVLRRFESDDAIRHMDWLWVEDYVYRDGAVVATERMPEEGGLQHLHADHLGTTRLITGAAGALVSAHDYLPFGIELTSVNQHRAKGYANEEPSRFTGHERDFHGSQTAQNENYLDYMHARFYNPKLGRFLSVDPVIPIKRAMRMPQAWNRYAYVANNPLRYVDPDGRIFYLAGEELKFNKDRKPIYTENQLKNTDAKTRAGLEKWAATDKGGKLIDKFSSKEYKVNVTEGAVKDGIGRAPQPAMSVLLAANDRSVVKSYDLILNPAAAVDPPKGATVISGPKSAMDMMAAAWAGEMLHIYFYSKGIGLPHHSRPDFQSNWQTMTQELGMPGVPHGND